jgi:hypothetical protein
VADLLEVDQSLDPLDILGSEFEALQAKSSPRRTLDSVVRRAKKPRSPGMVRS